MARATNDSIQKLVRSSNQRSGIAGLIHENDRFVQRPWCLRKRIVKACLLNRVSPQTSRHSIVQYWWRSRLLLFRCVGQSRSFPAKPSRCIDETSNCRVVTTACLKLNIVGRLHIDEKQVSNTQHWCQDCYLQRRDSSDREPYMWEKRGAEISC